MSAMGLTPQEFTTVELDGCPVRVRQAHRRWTAADYVLSAPEPEEYEPVAVTVRAPVGLSLEDVVAVLVAWDWPVEELAEDATVRWLVAEAVMNGGCLHIEERRCRLGEQTPDAEQAAYVSYCRQRAAAVFGATAAPGAAPAVAPGSSPVVAGVASPALVGVW